VQLWPFAAATIRGQSAIVSHRKVWTLAAPDWLKIKIPPPALLFGFEGSRAARGRRSLKASGSILERNAGAD
jgi:hypothetical protein